jgi:transposase
MGSQLSFSIGAVQPAGRLNVGIDMGQDRWVMDVLDTVDGRHHRFSFTDGELLFKPYEKIRELLGTGRDVDVIYEAGRNGFTPARLMRALGAKVTVVPVNRLEPGRRGKVAKSDRIDARALSERDARARGFPTVWVPTVDQECQRRMLKEKGRLHKEIKRANNRILSVLQRWLVPAERNHLPARQWRQKIVQWQRDGFSPDFLPAVEVACVENMVAELEVLETTLGRWEARIEEVLEEQRKEAADRGENSLVDVLMQYRGIGQEIALGLVWYVGDFTRFANGKKFASYLGLVPVPHLSGTRVRDQGISKAGNGEARRLMIELAWLWVRWQPDSPISRKWKPRLEKRGRSRKTAIVAVARELAVAILHLAKDGVEIRGAIKNGRLPVPTAILGSPLAA